jgi:hypothetical protein
MSKVMRGQNAVDTSNNILYVVLHGLVCLVDDKKKDRFTGYLIDRGDEHEYICGNFHGPEKDIDQDEVLTLRGVDKGTDELSTERNAVVAEANPVDGAIFAHSTIFLPRPYKILHFVCGGVRKYLKDSKSELKAPPKIISGTRVFQYSFSDYTKVQLLRKDGKTVFWPCPQPTMINTPQGPLAVAVLQLYNEPSQEIEGVAGILHNLYEFRDSLIFLGTEGVNLNNAVLEPADSDPLPYGLTNDQVCPLAMRDKVAAFLKKKGRKARFVVNYGKNFLRFEPRGEGGGTQVCGAAGGILG